MHNPKLKPVPNGSESGVETISTSLMLDMGMDIMSLVIDRTDP